MAHGDRARRAAERYAELLPHHVSAVAAAFGAETSRHDMASSIGHPVASVVSPLFVDESTFAGATAAAMRVTRGLQRVLERSADPRVDAAMRIPGLDPRHRALMAATPPPIVARADLLWAPGNAHRAIEYNGTSGHGIPGLMLQSERITRALFDTPVVAELRREMRVSATFAAQQLVDEMVRRKAELGRDGPPVILVLSPTPGAAESSSPVNAPLAKRSSGHPVARMRLLILLGHLQESGCRLEMGTPADLAHRDGRLWRGDAAIDFVFGSTELLADCSDDAPLLTAVLARHVETLDGYPTGWLLGQKQLFTLLSDPAWGWLFDGDEVEALRASVPWTRVLTAGPTTDPRGATVDVVEYTRAHRRDLVLKPFFATGGHGVMIGGSVDADTWSAAIEAATSSPTIVQERVPVGRASFHRLVGTTVVEEELAFDVDPYVWSGTWSGGCLARATRDEVSNVSAGGSLIAVFFVGPTT